MTTQAWTSSPQVAERNIALVRRVLDEGFTRGDPGVCDEFYTADAVEHQRGSRSGVDGVKEVIATLHRWMSDFRITVEDVIAQDDMVWVRGRATGTNDGHFMGFPPTGRRVDITVFDAVRIRDGRIVEHWGVPDQLGALLQLGLAPSAPARAAGDAGD